MKTSGQGMIHSAKTQEEEQGRKKPVKVRGE
jgi:hypothetical protein